MQGVIFSLYIEWAFSLPQKHICTSAVWECAVGEGAIHLVCTQKIGLFDPPPPPGTQNDVTVTINWPLLRTHLANPPPPP